MHWLDALRTFDAATVVPEYLGADYRRIFSACKWFELGAFNRRITPTEYDWYLSAS